MNVPVLVQNTVYIYTSETLVHVMFKRGKTSWFAFKRCPTVDNAALFQMKGHSVIVIIMTPGGDFILTKLCYLNVGLT